ncbi:zona pellucida sperm-binding protein 3-like [Bufo gargarizans]|uniref:zona pellucida sperm-binding protein 3-like n=1 Tax=Bufo gargarizans TaxID=30331 RepID=UPI001CF1093A|nr:zona pellucida sperm-binding protein 3-like [Bufo gargarizans]
MLLGIRWSWLLVALIYGSGFSSSLVRHRRQPDTWWRNYQPGWGSSRTVSAVGSPRGNPLPAVSGIGSLRGSGPVSGWGRMYPGVGYQSRQLTQPPPIMSNPSSPVRVQCAEDSMVVTVERDFYGNGRMVNPSDLVLGTCTAGSQTSVTTVVFQIALQECGSNLEMTSDELIYTFNLAYTPTTSSNVPIIRSNPAVVPIYCYYPRFGNVSSKAIEPTWAPFKTTMSSEERLSFSLRLMTEDWSAPRQSLVFQLGEIFYMEASVNTENHVPMMVFVDSCVATLTPDVNSNPSYEIIAYNGCLMDGMLQDASSAFVSPRPEPDKLQFTVDAFKFINSDLSLIYITCFLRAADINQKPDSMNKSCSYNKATSSWSPVEGPSEICQCCNTGNCATVSSRRTAWGPQPARSRGIGKRDVGSHLEKHTLATLGPLLVTGSKPNQVSGAGITQASTMGAGEEPLQFWVLVAIGSVTSVVVAFALTMAGKCLLKKCSHK